MARLTTIRLTGTLLLSIQVLLGYALKRLNTNKIR